MALVECVVTIARVSVGRLGLVENVPRAAGQWATQRRTSSQCPSPNGPNDLIVLVVDNAGHRAALFAAYWLRLMVHCAMGSITISARLIE